MPRERRRRRRRSRAQPGTPGWTPPEIEEGGGDDDLRVARGRRWWQPTLPVLVAFSGGLWIGATLSFADTASAAGLLFGVLGLSLGGARLISNRIRGNRRREARARRRGASGNDERRGGVS